MACRKERCCDRLLIWFLIFPRLARWALYLAAWAGLIITAIAAARSPP
jgi:hypothetical protein